LSEFFKGDLLTIVYYVSVSCLCCFTCFEMALQKVC